MMGGDRPTNTVENDGIIRGETDNKYNRKKKRPRKIASKDLGKEHVLGEHVLAILFMITVVVLLVGVSWMTDRWDWSMGSNLRHQDRIESQEEKLRNWVEPTTPVQDRITREKTEIGSDSDDGHREYKKNISYWGPVEMCTDYPPPIHIKEIYFHNVKISDGIVKCNWIYNTGDLFIYIGIGPENRTIDSFIDENQDFSYTFPAVAGDPWARTDDFRSITFACQGDCPFRRWYK